MGDAPAERKSACRDELFLLMGDAPASFQSPLGTPLPPPPHLFEAQPQELPEARPQQLPDAHGQQLADAQSQELPETQRQQGAPGLEFPQPLPLLANEHLEACVALDRQALDGLWSRQQWITELADPQRPGLGIWQRQQLLAMACAWLIVDELHITLVAVAPSQRRRGLGRRVLAALLREGSRMGAQRATLEVASGNQAAQSLYASLGFEVAGCRRGYYSNGDDALIEWLKLRV
jgi:ribosomal-protein-alanine N-acetyltransferase